MSHEESLEGESFDRKLNGLRARIDLLPPGQRPHLRELADAIARQHRRLQEGTPESHAS